MLYLLYFLVAIATFPTSLGLQMLRDKDKLRAFTPGSKHEHDDVDRSEAYFWCIVSAALWPVAMALFICYMLWQFVAKPMVTSIALWVVGCVTDYKERRLHKSQYEAAARRYQEAATRAMVPITLATFKAAQERDDEDFDSAAELFRQRTGSNLTNKQFDAAVEAMNDKLAHTLTADDILTAAAAMPDVSGDGPKVTQEDLDNRMCEFVSNLTTEHTDFYECKHCHRSCRKPFDNQKCPRR